MLEYTGHPLVDVGVATITAFAGKTRPEDLTTGDLEAMASYIEDNYTRNPLRSFLTVAFTSNAWFAQDAYNPDKAGLDETERRARAETRKRWADRHLRSWARPAPARAGPSCVFTGRPAVAEALSGTLAPGRAGRAQIPLLQGDDTINFYPGGASGVPVSGAALLCLQAFPLGCAKLAGSLLAVHADDGLLTLRVARRNLERNLREVSLAQHSGADKLPEVRHSLGTFLIGTLLDLERERADAAPVEGLPVSVTAYHLNNGKTPRLDIYHLPLEVTAFLQRVASVAYRGAWDAIVARAWQLPPESGRQARKGAAAFEPHRNVLYEDVLRLPDGAAHFLRRYFLRSALRHAYNDDPRRRYSPLAEADLVSWDLTRLFLREVLHVDPGRINQIRDLGDRLAAYVRDENDRRFFQTFLTEKRYAPLRLALIRADVFAVQHGQGPLISFEQFIEVFEDGEEVARVDWALARDLVLIRMIEQLHANGWLSRHAEALSEAMALAGGDDGLASSSQ